MVPGRLDSDTISEHDLRVEGSGRLLPSYPSLVVTWCRDEPWRLAQSLALPLGSTLVFGRGPAERGGPAKALLEERRPGRAGATIPLANLAVSRTQLEIETLGPDRVFVRNRGRCPLARNGEVVAEAEFRAGDVLQLGRQLALIVVGNSAAPLADLPSYPEFPFGEADPFGIVGESAAVWRLRAEIVAIAQGVGHVLVHGASGTGKELVVRAIHALSQRGSRPLVARSAATLPDALIDAELFGNQRNYPNAGMPERRGLVGEASGSGLFLDEIGELPQASQAHLLRLLDGGEYHRLGEEKPRRSDLRLLAATNRDPDSALKHDFRARFLFRLRVPGLDERREDIPLLARHLARRWAARGDGAAAIGGERGLDPDLTRELVQHDYSLHVRELEARLWQRLSSPTRGQDDPRTAADTPEAAGVQRSPGSAGGAPLTPEQIQRCLDEHNGALEATSKALGLRNRFALLRLIKRHNLEVRRRPGAPPRA